MEELPEGLRTLVDEAGATQDISRERLLDLCGQRSYVGGGGGGVVTPRRHNFCLIIKHLKESYLVGLCGLNLLTHEKLEMRIRKDLAPNHVKRPKTVIGKPIMHFGIHIYS